MDVTAGGISRKAEHSDLLDHAVRVGLVSYGVQHLLIAWLALKLAFGERAGSASSQGALHELASTGLGQVSLYVVAAGFVALVVWQGIEAAFGRREEEGLTRTYKRVLSAGKAVLYGTLAVTAAKVATGSGGGGGDSTDTWTARLMAMPAGDVLVALVGVGVLGVAGALAYRGWTEKFLTKLTPEGRTGDDGRAYVALGRAGYLAKAVALAIIGGLFVYAAWTHDPEKSAGMDQALVQLLEQPYGAVLLGVVAAGIGCFGVFCFAWARHLDR